jgi:hypothetical protein
MIPVETVPGIRGGGMQERSGGGNLSLMYLILCKNLCKCYNVPPPSTIIKKIKKRNGMSRLEPKVFMPHRD